MDSGLVTLKGRQKVMQMDWHLEMLMHWDSEKDWHWVMPKGWRLH